MCWVLWSDYNNKNNNKWTQKNERIEKKKTSDNWAIYYYSFPFSFGMLSISWFPCKEYGFLLLEQIKLFSCLPPKSEVDRRHAEKSQLNELWHIFVLRKRDHCEHSANAVCVQGIFWVFNSVTDCLLLATIQQHYLSS